jgi:hypothetical protein
MIRINVHLRLELLLSISVYFSLVDFKSHRLLRHKVHVLDIMQKAVPLNDLSIGIDWSSSKKIPELLGLLSLL